MRFSSSFRLKPFFKSLLLASFFLFSFSVGPFSVVYAQEQIASFSDVSRASEYYTAIDYWRMKGVFTGNPDGTFLPKAKVTRAAVVKMVLGAAKIPIAEVTQAPFTDVPVTAWFASFVQAAKDWNIVQGNPDGTFSPAEEVRAAAVWKMLVLSSGADISDFEASAGEPWYTPYRNFALNLGLIVEGSDMADPNHIAEREEMAQMMYLLYLVKGAEDNSFLLARAEAEMAQIEIYVAANTLSWAKRSSELAVDLTQQAYKNAPENEVVLGVAKLAKAYDGVAEAYLQAVQSNNDAAANAANGAINKATEAWQVNPETQAIASHIKDRACEIYWQLPQTTVAEPSDCVARR